MKTVEQVRSLMFAILAEIQHIQNNQTDMIGSYMYEELKVQLDLLYNRILEDEDIPERYWDDIEQALFFD